MHPVGHLGQVSPRHVALGFVQLEHPHGRQHLGGEGLGERFPAHLTGQQRRAVVERALDTCDESFPLGFRRHGRRGGTFQDQWRGWAFDQYPLPGTDLVRQDDRGDPLVQHDLEFARGGDVKGDVDKVQFVSGGREGGIR